MRTVGELHSQGAIFIYKSDAKKQLAWEDAKAVPSVRIEASSTRADLLESLRRWSSRVDATNASLCIYSHMAKEGMSPTGSVAELVTWQDFSAALGGGIDTLWLVGCNSADVLKLWPTPRASPVLRTLLVTSSAENWLDLVRTFATDVGLEALLLFFDEVEAHVRSLHPKLSQHIHYFNAKGTEWRKFVAPQPISPKDAEVIQSLSVDELSSILWPKDGQDQVIMVPYSAKCGGVR